MALRIEGSLTKWDDAKGYGFITPTQGGPEVFAHISAFPRYAGRPHTGQKVIFEVELDKEGKKKACRIALPEKATPRSPNSSRNRQKSEPKSSSLAYIAKVILLIAIGIYVYHQFSQSPKLQSLNPEAYLSIKGKNNQTEPAKFKCDGRTHCSQMTSCAEAKYFLNNCPNVQMDGNNDGEPCEQQWCTSLFAN